MLSNIFLIMIKRLCLGRFLMKNLFRVFLIIGIVVGALASVKLVLDLVGRYSKNYVKVCDDSDCIPF